MLGRTELKSAPGAAFTETQLIVLDRTASASL